MKVLLLGNGGREAALAWKLAKSPLVGDLFALPGNPGIAEHATCVPGDAADAALVLTHARNLRIDLVVVGPEAPLMAGVVDALEAAGVAVFGPSRAAARLEGSKAFAKEVLLAAGVPTARFEAFTDASSAERRAREWGAVVVKADGLAAGKGVIVAGEAEEAAAAVRSIAKLPGASTILLEERLSGPEVSVIALCDGTRCLILPPAQDHKRLLEGDRGPNTGGMGAWAPATVLSADAVAALEQTVFLPVLREMSRRGAPFRGALFAGLMVTPQGPMVLEFNARFGDPETQAILPLLEDDLVPLLRECAEGRLARRSLSISPGVSVAVVAAAPGYPEAPVTGAAISGVPLHESKAQCFQAGTKTSPEGLLTSGGRVLAIAARGDTLVQAREHAYRALAQVKFEGMQYRADIGAQGL